MTEVLEQIASGDRSLSVVMQPSDELPLTQLYVVKALESFSQIGKIRARQVLDELKISHKRKVGELTNKQRELIIEALK
jgi:ribosomal protein S13